MKKSICHILSLVLISLSSQLAAQGIIDSKHNLSRFGPGTIKARPMIQDEICVFCHTPHNPRGSSQISKFGWNRADSTATYSTYESSTMYADVGQPTGASKLCLSCHDGTIALGSILSQRNVIPFQGDWENSPANLGTHLADDHPISFTFDETLVSQRGELRSPLTLPPEIKLDAEGQVQCTSCHDPHDDSNGNFLVVSDPAQTLCIACHAPDGWESSLHALSDATWSGSGVNPWPRSENSLTTTVARNACGNCHQPHNAEGEAGLLSFGAEEQNCLKCHNGNVAQTDIAEQVQKPYAHRPQDFLGLHNAAESFAALRSETHVECTDCHDPHRANSRQSVAPMISGIMEGSSGINLDGNDIEAASFGYEVCFKCHADNNASNLASIVRELPQQNTRLEFREENPSFHPVASPRIGNVVPSLLPEITNDSMISCTDCHGRDVEDSAGPAGPHGSRYEFLLVRNYETVDNTLESPDAYALCYGCHDRNSILGDESFAEHDSHVRGNNTPCSVCHDPHGISETQGDARNHQYLINFDINVVSPNSLGDLYWEEGIQGPGSSRCSLACHGVDHNNTEDKPIGFDQANGLSRITTSWPFSGAFPD